MHLSFHPAIIRILPQLFSSIMCGINLLLWHRTHVLHIYKKKMPERVQQKEIYKLYNKKKKNQANCSPSVAQLTSIRLNSLITAD